MKRVSGLPQNAFQRWIVTRPDYLWKWDVLFSLQIKFCRMHVASSHSLDSPTVGLDVDHIPHLQPSRGFWVHRDQEKHQTWLLIDLRRLGPKNISTNTATLNLIGSLESHQGRLWPSAHVLDSGISLNLDLSSCFLRGACAQWNQA